MKKYLLPTLIALSALSVSASAAFYSVTGLSMLFAGASLAVLIMASSLEVAKLVIASLLYQYWDKLNRLLKIYLTIAACVLVLITSAGIYGFLSAAYQETATKSEIVDKQIAALESKKKLYEDTRDNILKEKQTIANLQGSLSQASTTQYTDKDGNLVVKSNNAAIRNIESASQSNEKLSAKIDVVNDSIFSLENQILEVKTNSEATSELGPLKYISKLTGQSMDKIINWFLLVIIFVFDPLAISLVIAANFAFAKIKPKEEDDFKDWDNTLMDGLEDETIEWDLYGNPSPVVDEETLEETFDRADTNDDGFIDEKEAQVANLDKETVETLNKLNKSAETVIDDIQQYYNLNAEETAALNKRIDEIKNLGIELGKLKNRKKDDDTITYF
jgi:hypothetical protein